MTHSTTDNSETPFLQQPAVRIVLAVLVFLLLATLRYYRAQHRAARSAQYQSAPAPPSESLPVAPSALPVSAPATAPPVPYSPARGFGSTRVPTPDPPENRYRTAPAFTDPRSFTGLPANRYRPGYGAQRGMSDADRLNQTIETVEQINAQNALRRQERMSPDSQAVPPAPQEMSPQEQPGQGQFAPPAPDQVPNQEPAPPTPPVPPVPESGSGNGSGEIPRF